MVDTNFIFNVTVDTFTTLVLDRSRELPVIVDFWATWCAPCQVLMPLLAKLAQEYHGKFILAKVNSDQEPQLAQQYGVRNLPTVKIFRHGKVVEEFIGAQSESVIRSYLDRHVERPSDQLRQQAATAWDLGDLNTALHYLRSAMELEPSNMGIRLDLARLFIARTELAEARQILGTIPEDQAEVSTLNAYLDFAEIAQGAQPQVLAATLATDPMDHDTRYRLATTQVIAHQYLEAIENLLEIVRYDRKFRNDGARKALLTIFTILGADNELAIRYRRRLVNLLN